MPTTTPSTTTERAAPPVVVIVALSAALIAASTVPLDRPGIGWFVAAVAATAAVAVAWRSLRPARSRASLLWTLVTLALFAVGAVRAAEWLFVLCVLTGIVTASFALAGGRSVRGLAIGAIALPVVAVRDLPWAARGVRALNRNSSGAAARMTITVAVSLGLVVVFGALFAGADAAFANIVGGYLPEWRGAALIDWLLVFGLVVLGVAGACSVLVSPPTVSANAPARTPLRRVEWALPVGVLVALFATFVSVQLTFLFGGSDYVLRTAGLTYAEYARHGFWQLCAVTLLALVVLGVVARRAARETAADRMWLRAMLGPLAALTLVIVGSALARMWAYQQAYGFTVLRVLVSACELWVGLVYVMVLLAGVRTRAEWLPRAVVATAVAWLLALAALDPDRFIAERNIERWESSGKLDLTYLGRLSADAVPALERLPETLRRCAMAEAASDLAAYQGDGWTGWNLARARARASVEGVGGDDLGARDCPGLLSPSGRG